MHRKTFAVLSEEQQVTTLAVPRRVWKPLWIQRRLSEVNPKLTADVGAYWLKVYWDKTSQTLAVW